MVVFFPREKKKNAPKKKKKNVRLKPRPDWAGIASKTSLYLLELRKALNFHGMAKKVLRKPNKDRSLQDDTTKAPDNPHCGGEKKKVGTSPKGNGPRSKSRWKNQRGTSEDPTSTKKCLEKGPSLEKTGPKLVGPP